MDTKFERKVVHTPAAPKAIGPYSQAVIAGPMVFVSGQIPIDPVTNTMVEGGLEEQVSQVLKNLQNILEAAGSGLENVVKTTVYLQDLGLFTRYNAVYTKFFPQDPPARATVEVSRLPRDVLVEIDAIALLR